MPDASNLAELLICRNKTRFIHRKFNKLVREVLPEILSSRGAHKLGATGVKGSSRLTDKEVSIARRPRLHPKREWRCVVLAILCDVDCEGCRRLSLTTRVSSTRRKLVEVPRRYFPTSKASAHIATHHRPSSRPPTRHQYVLVKVIVPSNIREC